jgi:peptide/nickel transport system ATP-binding protein
MYAGRIVEEGPLEAVFNDTLHPYTEGLFNSLPNIHSRTEDLKPIPGLMPDPTDLPPGCSFAPRCPYATEECSRGIPELKDMGGGHKVACRNYADPDFTIERRKKQ